ncbi:MAG: MFS transporter [Halovenus sp.]
MPTDTESPGTERLVAGYPGQMLGLLSLGLLLVQLGRGLVPNLLPEIIASLSITPFLAGIALSVLTGLHAVFQYPGGRFSDHLTRKTVLLFGLGAAFTGFAILAVADTYYLFLLGMAATGVGSGLFYTPMRSSVADLFVDRRGQAFGISQAAGSLGTILSAGLAVAMLAMATWSVAFVPVVATLLVLIIALHYRSREPYDFRLVRLDLRRTGVRLLSNSNIRWLLVAYSCQSLVFLGILNFLPAYLRAEKGFTPQFASGSFALFSLTSILVMPLSGRLSDYRSRTSVAAISNLVGAAGLCTLIFVEATPLVLASIVLFSAGMSSYSPVMQAYLMDRFPDSQMGGDFGAVKAMYTTLGSVGPLYLGYMASTAGYPIAFGSLVGALLASATISGLVLRSE